jgi:colanic acid/amylovoran biosynthesis glycosyltransferase
VYTGVDESMFVQRRSHSAGDRFEVLFRGRITDEAGVEYIIRAAKILEESDIFFKIIGFGWALPMARAESVLKELSPKNFEWIKKKLPFDELLKEMSTASISLGQFGNNDRLRRTIPHKAFESMLLGLPYITAEAEGVREAFEDGVTGFFVKPADAQAIADKIAFVRDHNTEAARVATHARSRYEKHFSKAALGATLVDVLQSND